MLNKWADHEPYMGLFHCRSRKHRHFPAMKKHQFFCPPGPSALAQFAKHGVSLYASRASGLRDMTMALHGSSMDCFVDILCFLIIFICILTVLNGSFYGYLRYLMLMCQNPTYFSCTAGCFLDISVSVSPQTWMAWMASS